MKSYGSLRRSKRQTVDGGAEPFVYPHIPERVQDVEASRGFPLLPDWVILGLQTKLIESVFLPLFILLVSFTLLTLWVESDSTKWGNPSLAIARATLETVVTPQNETLIRTYHPALSAIPTVYTYTEMTGKIFWKVLLPEGLRLFDTHVTGREIHIVPSLRGPDPLRVLMPSRVPIRRLIYPRRMLSACDISILRSSYPTSIGVRVFISGFIVLLFQKRLICIKRGSQGALMISEAFMWGLIQSQWNQPE